MLRYSSQSFTFHLIPSSTSAPYTSQGHALYDGIGTLALVNKLNEHERAMIIEVRPPSVVDGAAMREFAKNGRADGWWHLPAQYCVGEAGQANILQAQVSQSEAFPSHTHPCVRVPASGSGNARKTLISGLRLLCPEPGLLLRGDQY